MMRRGLGRLFSTAASTTRPKTGSLGSTLARTSFVLIIPNAGFYWYYHLLDSSSQPFELPQLLRSIYDKEGHIDNLIKNYLNEDVKVENIPTTDFIVDKQDNTLTQPKYVGEVGMTAADWTRLKDILESLETSLTQQILLEEQTPEIQESQSEQVQSADIPKEQAAKDSQTAVEADVEEERTQDIPQPSSSPDSTSDSTSQGGSLMKTIRNKILSLRTTGLEEAFPMNDEAISAAKLEESFTKDLESILVRDLNSTDLDDLKKQLVKLTLEFKERARWEAVRLSNVMEIERNKSKAKTEDLLAEQASLYRELQSAEKDAFIKEGQLKERARLEEMFDQELLSRKEEFKVVLSKRLEGQKEALVGVFNEKIAALKRQYAKQSKKQNKSFNKKFEASKSRLKDLEGALESSTNAVRQANTITYLYQSYIELISKCYQNQPFSDEIKAFAEVSQDDVLKHEIARIKGSVSAKGLSSEANLESNFQCLYKDLKKQVLIPENPSLKDTVLATVVSTLSFESGQVSSEVANEEQLLQKSRQEMNKGNLTEVVEILEQLQPKNRRLADSFISLAKDTLETTEALEKIKLRIHELTNS